MRQGLTRRSGLFFDSRRWFGPALVRRYSEALETAAALIAVLPPGADFDESLDTVIAALSGTKHGPAGVILSELDGPVDPEQRSRQYA
jgi:hypothetical protein